jgi:hypothetical protein
MGRPRRGAPGDFDVTDEELRLTRRQLRALLVARRFGFYIQPEPTRGPTVAMLGRLIEAGLLDRAGALTKAGDDYLARRIH